MTPCALQKQSDGRYALSGDLSFKTARAVLQESKALFRDGRDIVIDLAGVNQSDSAGLALVVEWLAQAKRSHATLCFKNIPPQMLSMAHASGMDELLPRCGGEYQSSEQIPPNSPGSSASNP